MINAKDELMYWLDQYNYHIKCAEIALYSEEKNEYDDILLKIGHTADDLIECLKRLDFEYQNNYGVQNIYGTVWLTNDTWLVRTNEDRTEKWEIQFVPIIPIYLGKNS